MKRDFAERVYAGLLGKIIGVYLGRPFEGWTYSRVKSELGYVDDFVHERLGTDPVVIDDDISGTLVFLRALREHGYCPELTSRQVGETWLNQLIDRKTILWWGGYGLSTEHTAYVNLQRGLPAPLSGSACSNGSVIAEQIGAQIFIDGWAMVSPGNPDRAVALSRAAARVSHDGEAVHAAVLLAAMEAAAFQESSIEQLLEIGLRYLPSESAIRKLVEYLRRIRLRETDWEQAFREMSQDYNYERFPGVCHVIPNHGIVMLALLYAGDDFRRAMRIACTLGWDTDCNAANVGCLTGIRLGLSAFANSDYREKVADRIYLTSAEGGSVSDALHETWELVRTATRLDHGEVPPSLPRFNFSLPGAIQGFLSSNGNVQLSNPRGEGLRVSWQGDELVSVTTPTFFQEEVLQNSHYPAVGTPEVYTGQTLCWEALACAVRFRPLAEFYRGQTLQRVCGSWSDVGEGHWVLPDTGGAPILRVGFELQAEGGRADFVLTSVDVTGEATLTFSPMAAPELSFLDRAWISSNLDQIPVFDLELGTVLSADDEHESLLYTGNTGWKNYRVESAVGSDLAEGIGIAARIRGLANYYALLVGEGSCQLLKVRNGRRVILAACAFPDCTGKIDLGLSVNGAEIAATLPGRELRVTDDDDFLCCGAAGYVVRRGSLRSDKFTIRPC